jgi:hypothetical protein
MSKLSCLGPFQENAIWLPSGENVGVFSYPGYDVRGVAGEPEAGAPEGDDAVLREVLDIPR